VNKILLHLCCAPCAVACVQALRAEGLEPVLYWFNPNIYPQEEYARRLETAKRFSRDEGLALLVDDAYYGDAFPASLATADFPARCADCYTLRLANAAKKAKELALPFSTTLLISPYQQHEALRAACQAAAAAAQADFVYRDFRPLFRAGQTEAKARGYYRQRHCGCVLSTQ
jgi:predicted adenine nucleotide alpha hydrolase (AANH) superfamily ATPase